MKPDPHDREAAAAELPAGPDGEVPEGEPRQGENWVLLILNIPKVGEFLAFCLAAAPLFLMMVGFLLLGDVFGFDGGDDAYAGYVLMAAIVPTYFWLAFLEDRAGVRLCLPIPIVNIPIKWLLLPAFLLLLLDSLGYPGG